jgi:hypothetical protein
MTLLLCIILLLILIIIFFIYSYHLKKIVLIKENFYQVINDKYITDQLGINNFLNDKEQNSSNNNSCKDIDDKCMIDQNGEHNCCKGYYCVRKDGNFQYKVCSDKPDPYLENNSSNQTEFQKMVTTTVDKASNFKDTITKKIKDFTEEEQLTLSVKDFCSSPYKIEIPNLFYGLGKNKKECECLDEKDKNNDDDLNFNPDLFRDTNFSNCQFFPV